MCQNGPMAPFDSFVHTDTSAHHPSEHAPFREHHERVTPASFDAAWTAALNVTAGEIRVFGPLMSLRGLPALVRGRSGVRGGDRADRDIPLLELFESEGFIRLDLQAEAGRDRSVRYGAVGKFWSPTGNHPVRFANPDEFHAFTEPGHAKLQFDVRVRAASDGVRLSTTTWVVGTDEAAQRRFAPYWALIRLPSGWIRRSWLAAIDRRAVAAC